MTKHTPHANQTFPPHTHAIMGLVVGCCSYCYY